MIPRLDRRNSLGYPQYNPYATARPSPVVGPKPPFVAAALSVLLPGVGHFYCGAWTRGFIFLLGSGVALTLTSVLGRSAGWLAMIAIYGWVAYDAYKTALSEAAHEAAEAAAPVPAARPWLMYVWALMRFAWIFLFVILFGAAGLAGIFSALRSGFFSGAAAAALPTALLFFLSYLAARSTYRVLTGTEALSLSAARNEIGGTIFFCGVAGLMFMAAYPSFKDLTRKSGEGNMKGNLAMLRDAFTRYRADHAENPPSLDAVAALTEFHAIPALWTTGRQPHPKTRETIVLADGKPTDSGKWAFAVGTTAPIFIDCTHTDSRGLAWHAY